MVQVHVEAQANTRLEQLDLTVELLERVIRLADAEARTCTPMDPPSLSGLIRWGRTNRFLRQETYASGWQFDNPYNLPRTIHPSGEFAVVATSGDAATGIEYGYPTTKYGKGIATRSAVATNGQLVLEFDNIDPIPAGVDVNLATWFLLYYDSDTQVMSELSLPSAIDESGFIEDWSERIILPVINLADGSSSIRPRGDGPDLGPDAEVRVTRL